MDIDLLLGCVGVIAYALFLYSIGFFMQWRIRLLGDKPKLLNVSVIADVGILKTVGTSGVATWCLRGISPMHFSSTVFLLTIV